MKRITVTKSNTAIERLAFFIEKKGLSFRKFEHIIDVGNGYIGKQLKRKAGVGSNILVKIHNQYPELNIMWLITGQQNMIVDTKLKIIEPRKSSRSKLRATA
jgi:hypothetical protein